MHMIFSVTFTRLLAVSLISAAGVLAAGAPGGATKLAMNNIKMVFGGATVAPQPEGQLRFTSTRTDGAAILGAGKLQKVAAGEEFQFSVEARGTVRLQVLVQFFGPDKRQKRLDLVLPTSLTGDWREIRRSFQVPDGFDALSVDFLIWKQAGYAELRNYTLKGAETVEPRMSKKWGMEALSTAFGGATAVPQPDGVLRFTSPRADGGAFLRAGKLTDVAAGEEFQFSVEARGTVRLQVLVQFFGADKRQKRLDLVLPTPLTGEWQEICRAFQVPEGFDAFSVDFLIWKQTGYAELRNYALKGALKRGETVLFEDRFVRGAMIDNRFSDALPACWRAAVPGKNIGGLTRLDAPARGGKSLLISARECDPVWRSFAGTLPQPHRPLQLTVTAKPTGDWTGSRIFAKVLWYDAQGKPIPGAVREFALNATAKGAWLNNIFEIPAAEIPAAAAAFHIELGVVRGKDRVPGDLFVSLVLVTAPEPAGNFARIRCENSLNWTAPGKPIRFRANGRLPDGTARVVGKVFDSRGKPVAEVAVPPQTMYDGEWKYDAAAPGFYEVEFFAETPSGMVALPEEFSERGLNEQRGIFVRSRHGFAVVEEPQGPRSTLFGFQLFVHPWQIQNFGDNELRIARQVGCRFVRFPCQWGVVEPKKGEYRWEAFDWFFDRIKAAGLEAVVGLQDTPRWASSHPEDDRYVICVWAYAAYAPRELADWERFVEAVATRYKGKITEWEIWNESNLPGRSCFWHDTPENFVKLLQSAHRIIKRTDPKSLVLAGGWNDRYLPFYDRILQCGAGAYIDMLSLHGSNNTPAAFHATARKYGAPEVPWMNSEWHWGLIRHDYVSADWSEARLTAAMMRDFLFQLQQGVREINIFEAANYVEREALRFHAKSGTPLAHAGGTYRRHPWLEPRLAAVVFGNMHRQFFTGTPKAEGFFRFGNQKAIRYRNASNDMLVFWLDGEQPEALVPELAQAADGAIVKDWEGKKLNPQGLILRPRCFYYVFSPKINAAWRQDAGILKIEKPASPLEHETQGLYGTRRILDGSGNPITANIRWNDHFQLHHWNNVPQGFAKPTRFAAALADGRFQLIVETADQTHCQNARLEDDLWRGDCLEIGIDPEGKGLSSIAMCAARTKQGDWLYKSGAPTVVGDCPTDWTPAYNMVKTGRCRIIRDEKAKKTSYLIDLPETELYPFVPTPGQTLRLSLLVGENNGRDRIAVSHWGNGILRRNLSQYGDLKPAGANP